MKVGICIPNYNMASYLSSAIESGLNQSYKNCTIYILDNDSEDESWEIIKEYKKEYKNIEIFRNDYTISMEENWNKVLRFARNEDFINILSSDDKLHPDYIEECLKLFRKYQNLGYVYTEKRDILDNNILNTENFYSRSGIIPKNEEFLINIKGFHTAPCQLLIRNQALKEVSYLSTEYGIVSDMHLTLKLNTKFDVGYICKKLVDYNISSGMSRNYENIKLMAIQFSRLKNNILKNHLPIELESDFKVLSTYNNLFCSKFCLSQSKQLIKENYNKEAKEIFLLAVFFDNELIENCVFKYMINNHNYNIEEFTKNLNKDVRISKMPYDLPKNSIILKG